MALQYPIAFVTRAPATERLNIERRTTVGESPFTYKQVAIETASRWTLEWTFPRMPLFEAERVSAWLFSLKGQLGSFRYAPRQSVAGTLTGRSLSRDAYAYNDTLQAGGWAAGAQSYLRTGQWISVGSQLLRVTSSAAFADGAGNVTITFEPSLRVNFPAGTAVEIVKPQGVFRLSDAFGGFTLDPDRAPDFGTLTAREVV